MAVAVLSAGCHTGSDHGSLSDEEYDLAVAASQHRLDQFAGETVTAAYAVLQSAGAGLRNDGCPSRVIHVTLVGDYLHSDVLPAAGQSATITAEVLFLDPGTGRACGEGALTRGDLAAPEGSADLLPALR